MFTPTHWTDRIREATLPYHVAEVEIHKPGLLTTFDPETNTGGVRESAPVYKGKARVQQFSNNRDHNGAESFNPNSEVGYRVQVTPLSGWVADFNNITSVYESELGKRSVLRDWRIKIVNGGENPSLENKWLIVDVFANASSRAVVDIVCTLNSDTAQGDPS